MMVLSRLLHRLLILLLLKLVVHLDAAALDECKIMRLLSFWCLVNLLVLTVSSSQLGACAVCLVCEFVSERVGRFSFVM